MIYLVGRVGIEPTTNGLKVPPAQHATTNNSNPYKDLRSPVRCRRLWITAVFYR
jgi:hypothetical protein